MDLTVVAIPAYLGGMGAEHVVLKRRAAVSGPSVGDYERSDTIASISVGAGSLLAPLLMPKLLDPLTPGKGRYGKALVATAVGAAAVTTVADVVARRGADRLQPRATRPVPGASGASRTAARRCAGAGEASATRPAGPQGRNVGRGHRGGRRRRGDHHDVGVADHRRADVEAPCGARPRPRSARGRRRGAGLGLHLLLEPPVHAREPVHVGDPRGAPLERALQPLDRAAAARRRRVRHVRCPYGAARLRRHPARADRDQARGVNLLYQYWIHTETIRKLGPFETVLNTPSHHRVHHGSNQQYLDRNHGSILIIWDRLFGTFEPEDEPVVYGLTKNIDTFNPAQIATHEHVDMLRDVGRSTTWRERLCFVVRGPGWAYARHAESGRTGADRRRGVNA